MTDTKPVPPAPAGMAMLQWVGPAIVWMVSSIATGELLFTPRVASLYGYTVLWMLVLAIFLKAAIAREIGRFSVATGGSFLDGMARLPGPRNWGIWIIVMPQILVAVTAVAGIAGATGSAVILLLPGSFRLWGIVFLIIAAALVLLGKYHAVERASIGMSLIIIVALVITALVVFPGLAPLVGGLLPSLPENADFAELLPWLGFMMSGAAGLIWYSYWLVARGYGSAGAGHSSLPVDPAVLTAGDREQLKKWTAMMTGSTLIASFLVLVLLIALLILGNELLRPQGLLPEGPEVTDVLSRLLAAVWGPAGRWLMIVGTFLAFASTLIANVDGWGRLLGQGSTMIAGQLGLRGKALSPLFYRTLYVAGLMCLLPAIMFFVMPEPVLFLIVAGIIEAIHIPVVAAAILYLNLRMLPRGLRPSLPAAAVVAFSVLFFVFFAAYYVYMTIIP